LSASWFGGPASWDDTAPQTAQRLVAGGRPVSTDFFAISKISGEMIGSAIGFFFILDLTIEQIGGASLFQEAYHCKENTLHLS
jgi:hypothetical protein